MKNRMLVSGTLITVLLVSLMLWAINAPDWFLKTLGIDNPTLWQLLVSTLITICFAAYSLFLYRQNRRLEDKIHQLGDSEAKLQKLSSAVTNSGSSIIITNRQGIIEYVNHKFTLVSGYESDEIVGQTLEILNPQHAPDIGADNLWSQSYLQPSWEGKLFSVRKDGHEFWSAITVSAVRNKSGQVTNYVVAAVDITELTEANRKMQQLALFDSLTGLANRRLFMDRLNNALASCRRERSSLALLFLDLDQFKRINDTLGHDAGDILLLTIADRLKGCVREKDTVSRLGGDEFTVLLTDVKDTYSVTHVAQQILKALKQPIKLHKHEVIVSTSIGITLAPADSNHAETLMKNADLALYRAKECGRDRYHFFTEELNIQALKHLVLEQELRSAHRDDEFTLAFQPQVDLRTESVISVEALLRWNHPQPGLVSPDDFITVAEETGLIIPIGRWVLRNACMQVKMIHELTGHQIKVAVNLSTRQFRDPRLEQIISEVLVESGLSPEFLELEVTESMLMDDIDKVIEQLTRIKSTGVTITIDDFGSGYSSLSYLKRLPVDILKVDRQFVQDIPDDISDMEITSAVIAVAHKLNLKVIAEGVEDIDQRDFLVINKCDFAQGYYYSKPLTFEQLYQYLQNGKLRAIA